VQGPGNPRREERTIERTIATSSAPEKPGQDRPECNANEEDPGQAKLAEHLEVERE
jgi:hypothetical protein